MLQVQIQNPRCSLKSIVLSPRPCFPCNWYSKCPILNFHFYKNRIVRKSGKWLRRFPKLSPKINFGKFSIPGNLSVISARAVNWDSRVQALTRESESSLQRTLGLARALKLRRSSVGLASPRVPASPKEASPRVQKVGLVPALISANYQKDIGSLWLCNKISHFLGSKYSVWDFRF